jgi:4-hydroxy-tetrahydrodipicolinate reductase
MGQESIKAVSEDPELELVAQTDLGDNLSESISQFKAQVVVDFTTAFSALKNTVSIIESGARPVIGTSGLLPEEIAELQVLCTKHKLGGIIAPNFAIGAVLMRKYPCSLSPASRLGCTPGSDFWWPKPNLDHTSRFYPP